METKNCNACGCTFTPRLQNPNQKYCTNSECQRERRRRWQQQARQGDSDYRDNDTRSSKTWAAENPEYWKRYREEDVYKRQPIAFSMRKPTTIHMVWSTVWR